MKNKILLYFAIFVASTFTISDGIAQDGNIWQGTPCNECQNQLNFNVTNAGIQHFNAIYDCTPLASNNQNEIGASGILGWFVEIFNELVDGEAPGAGTVLVSVELFEIAEDHLSCTDEADRLYGVELDYIGDTYCLCLKNNNCGECNN